jgi:hypothetical protein
MKLGVLRFDQSAKKEVLNLFGKTLDDEGYIVEKENKEQKVLTKKGEEIHIDEWAGIVKGSEEFVKSDTFSLVEIAKRLD